MADKDPQSWKMTAIVLIWTAAAVWAAISLFHAALGSVLAALSCATITAMLVTGYSSADVNKL